MNNRISKVLLISILLTGFLTAAAQAAGPLAGWGGNSYGNLNFPAAKYTAVAAGNVHSLAIRSDGTLAGCGWNENGQVDVPAGTFTAVAAGFYHSLGIRSDGTLAGWGNNSEGEINVPAGTFNAIAAGWYHSLAIRSDGTLAAWGNNGTGQLNVPSGTFVTISSNYVHSLAIRNDGTLVAWGCGANDFGQCNVPAGTFTAVAAGQFHSLAIRGDGTLTGWGRNESGQLNVPPGTFTAVATGGPHGLAIRSDGTLAGWGYNFAGQTDVPTGIFTAVAAGSGHSLGVYSDSIPVVTEWGLMAMTILVLTAGTLVLARRRATLGSLADRSTFPVVAGGLLWLVFCRGALAQPATLPSQEVVLNVDSGLVSATQGTDPGVVFSHVVRVEGAPWIRLYFGEVQLSGSPSAGNASFLRITSEEDGDVQDLDSAALVRWGNTSAYFNGEAVEVELLARAGTGENRVLLDYADAGVQSEPASMAYICGPTDDRVPSSDPRVRSDPARTLHGIPVQ